MSAPTKMLAEALEAPDAVARQLDSNAKLAETIGARLRALDPPLVVTCARGSSDCAATYGKYLIETRANVPVASMAPSIASVYGAQLKLKGAAFIAISQSGRSPDLIAAAEMAKRAGAHVIALVNDETAPLGALADTLLPLHAGPEQSVAATKSFICSLSALAQITFAWAEDRARMEALRAAPDLLRAAANEDWSHGLEALRGASSVLVLGRGLGFGAAQEAALKLKETCGLHAEAYSAAEVRHGPMAILRENAVVLALRPADGARAGMDETLADFARRGVRLLVAGGEAPETINLKLPEASAEIAPLSFVQSFYRFANDLALMRGENPDAPLSLSKVTETI